MKFFVQLAILASFVAAPGFAMAAEATAPAATTTTTSTTATEPAHAEANSMKKTDDMKMAKGKMKHHRHVKKTVKKTEEEAK